jgi:hypothetical protein
MGVNSLGAFCGNYKESFDQMTKRGYEQGHAKLYQQGVKEGSPSFVADTTDERHKE